MRNVEQLTIKSETEDKRQDLTEGELSLESEEVEVPELTQEQKETIEVENKWVKENFQELIDEVNEHYSENTELSEAQKESFKKHNEQILELCIERGVVKGLSEAERAVLYFAAIRHDSTKGDKAPQDKEGIANYILAIHGETAAKEAKEFFEDKKSEEYLDKILSREQGRGKYPKEKIVTIIENAIRRHMGPHREDESQELFFMDKVLNGGDGIKGVNEQLPRNERIEHPRPETKIDKILFAVDMRSLASPQGTQKLLDIRAAVPIFRRQDQGICAAYERKYGRPDLAVEETAFHSAFESAEQARDSIDFAEDPDDWVWINQAVEEIKKGEYRYVAKGEAPKDLTAEVVAAILAKEKTYQKAKQAWREELEEKELAKAREELNKS